MADSPDQRQLKLQKGYRFTNANEENIFYESNKHKGPINKNMPHTIRYVFLARFGVCFGGELRRYASRFVEVPPFEEPQQSISTCQIECIP